MLSIDFSVFIQIANFLILLLLLNAILFRPVRSIMGQRNREMDDLKNAAATLQSKAAEHTKALEEGLVSARKQGFGEKEGLRAEALGLEKKMYQDATASAGGKMAEARKRTEEKVKEIRRSLEEEIGLFSRELAEKVLGRRLQ
jgi:F-type H+-transporting ATPase subunit b